ncbi:MAG: nucleotidyltransferase family protein [Alphaproteobacteria bacterium]|nr:MAG: nucleotidyltransferase family protein [Alphaproteobacteria bacterium]
MSLILADPHAVDILKTVRDHGPAGAHVAAGFVRNRVWDSFYDPAPDAADSDIDVIYHDAAAPDPQADVAWEALLSARMPGPMWQVRNQARMHVPAGDPPYRDIAAAMAHWPETATAVAVCLRPDGSLGVVAPFGLDDLFGHILRPTPAILKRDRGIFDKRVSEKEWLKRWPRLSVVAATGPCPPRPSGHQPD